MFSLEGSEKKRVLLQSHCLKLNRTLSVTNILKCLPFHTMDVKSTVLRCIQSLIIFYLFKPDVKCRGHPIGMQSKEIPDENIVASSWQEPFHSFRPEAGRLDNEDGVWCPNTLGNPDKKHYVQIEFPSRYNVCAVATQGSPLHSTDWVKKYRLQFSLDGKNFTTYTENGTVKVQFPLLFL